MDDFADDTLLDPSSLLERKDLRKVVTDTLETMSVPLKSVGMMRFNDDFKIEEIASILDIPKGTVNSRINRIKKNLRISLEKEGVTLKSYAITPIFIKTAYDLLLNTEKYKLGKSASQVIFANIVGGSVGIGVLTKLGIVGIVTSSVLGGAVIYNRATSDDFTANHDSSNIKPYIEPMILPAKISSISYNTAWTNQAIHLDVETTSKEYDKILVNNIETIQINKNGTYRVELIKDNKIVDYQDIEVKNIDLHSPEGYFEENDNSFIIYLSDDLSQINPDSIQFFRDGSQSYDFVYDVNNHSLIISKESEAYEQFFVSDYAQNILEIEVK